MNLLQSQHQIQDLLSGALALHQSGQLPQAEAQCRRMLQVEPNLAEALHLMGIIAYQQGHHRQAAELISKAIENKPTDAMFHNNLGLVQEALNHGAAAKQSYKKALQIEAGYADAYNNLGNLLKKEGQLDAAILHLKHALHLNPRMPEAHYNLAKSMAAKGDLAAAIAYFQKAIALKPDYTKAYISLGNAQRDRGDIEAAIESFQQALRLRPDHVGALNNLGNALRACDRLAEALNTYSQAVTAAPNSAESHCNLGNAFKDSGQFDNALVHYQHAVQLRPDFAAAHFNAATIHLLTENFKEGWQEYEWRLQRKEWKSLCSQRASLPHWKGQSFSGKKVLVYDEQGYGDTLQFVRYLPFVKTRGGEVIFETRRELMGLLSDFQGADAVVERSSYAEPARAADMYISLLSLPAIFQTDLESIPGKVPYLFAGPDRARYWRERLSRNTFKVGLVWAGQAKHKDDHHRSCKLNQFAPLLEIPGVEYIGLQKGSAADQAAPFAEIKGFDNFGEDLVDFADTAGLIENLDLVISVDTAVAHLAGAMGKPVWVLLPLIPDWRWMTGREDSPWYPTVRLFRQKTRNDWDEVIERVGQELHARIAAGDKTKQVSPAAGQPEDCCEQGIYYYDLNNLPRATDAFQKAIALKPDFFEAHFYLGNIYQDRQNFKNSISHYKNALQINPEAYQACYNLGLAQLAMGQLDEAAAAFQQTIDTKPDFYEAYNNLGVVLQKQDKLSAAIQCFQKSVELHPAYAEAYYNMGRTFYALGQTKEAEHSYRLALAQKPDYAEAHHNLGIILHRQSQFAQAAACYRKTIQLKPADAGAYYDMGNIFLDQGHLEEMTNWYQKAVELTPKKAEAYNNLGKMLQDQGRIVAAETYFQAAIASKPHFADAHFNRSMVLLLQGNYAEGWAEYEWRFKKSNWKRVYPYRFEQPRWDGTSFKGKKIFVHCEQGLGDTIQFARYLPMVKERGGTVIFETPQSLLNVFSRFPGIDQLVEISAQNKTAQDFDIQAPLLSLPGIFQTMVETIPSSVPYLCADPQKKKAWQNRFAEDLFNVGIVWAGGRLHKKDKNRSIPLEQFISLERIAGVRLYGLQKGPASHEIEAFSNPGQIENYGEQFEDLSDTAGFIENLDLVISVDTAVAHLAGAMGKAVWVLLPFVPDWRWMMDRTDSPWYPTMRLFRQKEPGRWDDVIQNVIAQLRQMRHRSK